MFFFNIRLGFFINHEGFVKQFTYCICFYQLVEILLEAAVQYLEPVMNNLKIDLKIYFLDPWLCEKCSSE